MTKNKINKILGWIMGITATIVSLTIGFSMISGTLLLPTWLGGNNTAMFAGWIVIITTALSVLGTVFNTLK